MCTQTLFTRALINQVLLSFIIQFYVNPKAFRLLLTDTFATILKMHGLKSVNEFFKINHQAAFY